VTGIVLFPAGSCDVVSDSHTTVCVTYDFDAVAAWAANGMAGYHDWGVYGAEVAAPRLLDLHDRLDVPATWFVPGHTIKSFPEVCGDVWDRGYDVQHHGWSHQPLPSFGTRAEERRDLERGIEAIRDLTGRRPEGFRTPDGGFSKHTVDLLEALGFEWDSSDAAHDCRPYRLRTGASVSTDEPYDPGVETDIVEVPVVWHRDDWMQLFPLVSGPEWVAYSDEERVFGRWRDELDWLAEHEPGGVFVLLLHPQCAGRAPFLDRLEPFFETVNARPDVEFGEVATVADSFAE
jgi:peptidoglycan/xylan/chitin deacetylase (PgdA/CDA1 family)